MKRFFRNASAPAEEEAVEEQSAENETLEEETALHGIPYSKGYVIVDESLAELVYKSPTGKLIKTSKGHWVIAHNASVTGWGTEYHYNVPMPDVYRWLRGNKVPLPPEVEEWAKSVTE